MQGCDGVNGAALAQRSVAAAEDQLLGLREELDFTDTAASEFDVVPRHGNFTMTAMGMDLPLDGMNVFNGCIIEIAPPHERLQRLLKRFGCRGITRTAARLDEGCALPVLPHLLVIAFGGFGGDRNLCRSGIRPKPEIRAKDISVRSDLAQESDKAANDVHSGATRVPPLAEWKSLRVIKRDQIKIAGIVELECARLAHREKDQARVLFEFARIALGNFRLAGSFAKQKTQRAADARIGEARQHPGDGVDVPLSCNIGKRDGERGHRLRILKRLVRKRGVLYSLIGNKVGADFPKLVQGLTIANRQPAQIRTVAERAREHVARRGGNAGDAVSQRLERPLRTRRIKHPRQRPYTLCESIARHRHSVTIGQTRKKFTRCGGAAEETTNQTCHGGMACIRRP